MVDQITLEKIEETAVALDRCGVSTLEDFRSWISKDVDKSIPRLAEVSGTPESLLMALVIAEFYDETVGSGRQKVGTYWRGLKPFPSLVKFYWMEGWRQKRLGIVPKLGKPSWFVLRQLFTRNLRFLFNWRRRWADGLLIAIVPLLLLGFWLHVEWTKRSRVQFVTVKPSANVRAYQRIADEVELTSLDSLSNAFSSIDQVKDHYSLIPLSSGVPVLSDHLLSAELSNKIKNSSIVSIPLKAATYVRDLSPPFEAELLLSPRENGNETTSQQHAFKVVLLGIDKTGDAVVATVAINAADVEKTAALLGSSDAYLSKPAR